MLLESVGRDELLAAIAAAEPGAEGGREDAGVAENNRPVELLTGTVAEVSVAR